MERLTEKFYKKISRVPLDFQRYLLEKIDWNNRLIGIKGARGSGKTTLLLQYAKLNLPGDHRTLYVSLDDLYFTENKLVDLADKFVKEGGRYLLLDEVHRYPNWSQEIKNIYDDQPDLTVIFTGSSVIHIEEARGDLSRRAIMYELFGLSFREYLNFKLRLRLEPFRLEQLIDNHINISRKIADQIRPLEHFKKYLQIGYYPYFMENEAVYLEKLSETVALSLSTDLPSSKDIGFASIEKIRLLLHILAESVPFIPNITKLSERTGVTRASLLNYLKYLEDLRLLRRLYASTKGIGLLQKPEKLYLHHPNLNYALSDQNVNIGGVRESFFINQVSVVNPVTYPKTGDFKVSKYTFEIGGKDKSQKQLKNLTEAYIAADNIEIGYGNKIPVWLFGFLY